MCRISGIVDPSRPIEELQLSVKRMSSILKKGGPDGEGIYISDKDHLVFGHRRLALLDLSEAGHQPMSYNNDQYNITYNGEIYNYPQLKIELEKEGFVFHTLCDTEMILAAFAAWGTKAFKKFNGMFAFALFDNRNDMIYLVRDPSGIKPLYYYYQKHKLYFSSEVKSLSIFPELDQQDPNAKILLLAYGHIPEPHTTLKEVKMLPKGTFFSFHTKSGNSKLTNFLQYQYFESISDKPEAMNLIFEKLSSSVSSHLLSDAPIGVFLSGGIDSSLLALLAHKKTGDHLNTLSLYYNELKYSEKKYQDLIIDTVKCRHRQFLLTGMEFSKHFESIVNDMDMPSTDGLNTWFISKYAKECGLKAVLSGVGSDEMFGGYPSFRRISNMKIAKKLPNSLLRSFQYSQKNKLKRLAFLSIPGCKGEYLYLRGRMLPSDIVPYSEVSQKKIWDILSEEETTNMEIDSLSYGNQASWMEMNLYMQNQLLRDSDVMSMAHGVEIRVPFLEKDLVSAALSLTSKIKFKGHHPKQLLIDTFKKLIPEPIWNRPKMGFAFPYKEWMKDNEFVKNTMHKNALLGASYQKFNQGILPWSHILSLMVMHHKIGE